MGLDLLDLILRLEETFQIQIKADEFQEWVLADDTVGALYRHIMEKLGPNDEPVCLGARLFYRFRQALAETVGTPAERVAPFTEMEAIIPLTNRRQHWRRLAQALDLPLPPLRRPVWMTAALVSGWSVPLLLGALSTALRGKPGPEAAGFLLALLMITALKTGAAHAMTLPYAVCFPRGCDTVKNFIKTLLRRHYGRLMQREGVWHPQEVWHVLQDLLVDLLGVSLEKVKADAHLVKDLGAA